MSAWRLNWPYGWGGPVAKAVFKSVPEDFQVEEILTEPFTGEGEHLCLWLEKRGDNTEYVARELARCLDVAPMAVSFCGRKDRQAITRQWFSVQLPGVPDEVVLDKLRPQFVILATARHRSKLRRGQHWGNRFVVRLRSVEGNRDQLELRLKQLAEQGSPNYFGPQRFGHEGGNLVQADVLNPKQLRGKNFKAGLYLSSARSWLFNEVLGQRVEAGTWLVREDGDPGDGISTGPLFADGGGGAREPLAGWENAFLAQYPNFDRLFRARRLRPERRSLSLRPESFTLSWQDEDLVLEFSLPAGGFATTWLGEAVTLVSTSDYDSGDD